MYEKPKEVEALKGRGRWRGLGEEVMGGGGRRPRCQFTNTFVF